MCLGEGWRWAKEFVFFFFVLVFWWDGVNTRSSSRAMSGGLCGDPKFLRAYIYIISSPNLGLEIAVPGREREQGRIRGSSKEAWGSNEGATR